MSCELGFAALQHRPGKFFDKERYAAGTFNHRTDSFVGQGLLCRDLCHHSAYVARAQTVQIELSMVRPQRPCWMKLRPRGEEQKQRSGVSLLNQELKQLECRGIGPMQIFQCD